MHSRSEQVPFLEKVDTESASSYVERSSRSSRLWTGLSIPVKAFVVCLIVIVYTSLVVITVQLFPRVPVQLNNAIKNAKFNYRPTLTVTAGMSPYAGGPGEEIDDAWHDLMSSISVRVSQSELNKNGNHKESVELPQNGGHLVWLGVFHQLHCLKMIRQMNYRDAYHPNQTENEARDMEVHINHCIEMLRQAVMCNPDTSLTTFVWTHSDPKPVLDVRRFERQCVDWDGFMEEVRPRVVSYEEVDDLQNPLLNSTIQV